MKAFKKIGVWQTAFLGDAVLTLPLLLALRKKFPEAELELFVRAGLEDLFSSHPALNRVTGFAKRGGQKSPAAAYRFGKKLRTQGFDLWISAHTSLRSALIAKTSAIPTRIGYDSPWFNRLAYTRTVSRRFNELEEIERLFQLVEPLGITPPAPKPRLVLPDPAREKADAFWADNCGERKVLGVHPGSTWPTKCWPEEYFSKIVRKGAESGAVVLVFGGPGEEELAARIVEKAKKPGLETHIVDLSGQLALPELAAYLGRLDACLTNDSGPMHLAWVQNTPLVAIFGPTVKELGFYPRGENSLVMETALDCRPCGLHGPKHCPEKHHKCMRDIPPEKIWKKLAAKLKT